MTTDQAQGVAVRPALQDVLRGMRQGILARRQDAGFMAALRRGSPEDVAHNAPFHRVLAGLEGFDPAPDWVRPLAVIAMGMALTVDGSPTGGRDGAVLAKAGLTESRFARLLASRGEGLQDQLLLLARLLRARELAPTWQDLGVLALADAVGAEWSDDARLRLATAYYRVADAGDAKTSTNVNQ